MSEPFLTFGFATTADDPGAVWTAHMLYQMHPKVMERCELVVVNNRPTRTAKCQALADEISKLPNARYIEDDSPMSSYHPRSRIFAEARASRVAVCDSHVTYQLGSPEALIAFYEQNPTTQDLISGPLVERHGKVSATQQLIYEWEGLSPKNCHGGVTMHGQWFIDDRGRDPTNEPFEIQKTGLGFFSCRKDAWPGFPETFTGYGGGEVYLCERFRQLGRRVLCHPGVRWWHNFVDYQHPLYPKDNRDAVRNCLLSAQYLDRPDLWDAAIWKFSKQHTRSLRAVLDAGVVTRPAGNTPYQPPPLPGSKLQELFKGFPECQQCAALAAAMNRWGPALCRDHVDDLVSNILPRAKKWMAGKHRWATALLGAVGAEDPLLRVVLRQFVVKAIDTAA